jgi:hypothetical protein
MIELRDFVSRVLTEVVAGTNDAQAQLAESGARVNDLSELPLTDHVTKFEFDVEISTEGERSQEGKAGIFVGKSGVGGTKGSTSRDSSVGRIQFAIHLHLPNGSPDGSKKEPAKRPRSTVNSPFR